MSDTVSRKALNDLIKNRLRKVLVYASDAEEIKDPFDRGKATAYQNILHDISAKLTSTESDVEIESLKAITELAVKGFKRIVSESICKGEKCDFGDTCYAVISKNTLSEIERLQNE